MPPFWLCASTRDYPRDVAVSAAKRNRLVKPAGPRAHDVAAIWRNHQRTPVSIGYADNRVIVRRRSTRLEGFQNGPASISRPRAHAALGIDADQLDSCGDPERDRRLVRERELEEVAGDRRRQMTTGGPLAQI